MLILPTWSVLKEQICKKGGDTFIFMIKVKTEKDFIW